MSEYQVIARKWRPQRFSEVIGQEHITRTLKNAIIQDRTAHAYLFVGPRGIGKTTSARIFAKALNCAAPEDGEPCCKCDSCVGIANGSNMDVIEIDAASQNSVQSIRDLCEEVMFSPVKSKYKVYIVDEVHMLQATAWNAFLKTIEEPPAHAKFIFATTEAHKVLPTIISRCQRFDLRRIPAILIYERLKYIADSENVKISQKAIEAIARAADGGMRDAQSLLDQMISFFDGAGNNEISEEQVLALFGLTAGEEMEVLVKSILENDKPGVIANIHNLASKGKNLETLFDELMLFLRGVQMCALISNPEDILEVGEDTIAQYRRIGQGVKSDIIQRLLENLSPVGNALHSALNKQVFLETIILKSMRIAHSIQIESLIARLNMIRNDGDLEILDKVPELQAPVEQPRHVAVEKVEHQVTAAPTPPPQPVKEEAPPSPEPENIPVQEEKEEPVRQEKPEPEPEEETVLEEPEEYAKESFSAQEDTQVYKSDYYSETEEEEEDDSPYDGDDLFPKSSASSFIDDFYLDSDTGEPENSGVLPEDEEEEKNDDGVLTDASGEHGLEEILPEQVPELISGMEEKKSEPDKASEVSNTAPSPEEEVKKKDLEPLLSPRDIWHKLLEDAEEHLKESNLKSYMAEGDPVSFDDSLLTVVFDGEYEPEHVDIIKKNQRILNKRLQSITRDYNASIKIKQETAIHDLHSRSRLQDVDEVRKRIEKNEFVRETMDLFEGRIVDIHG